MKNTLIIAAIIVVLCACTDPKGATNALQASGYKDVQITGYDFLACSKDDFYCTGFTATAPNDQRVDGAVGGWFLFKGSTIRIK